MSRHRTRSGTFEVYRDGPCLALRHVPSGLPAGGFSHLSVRTFKYALAGMEEVEAGMGIWLGRLAPSDREASEAVRRLQIELKRVFPNGAWSR